MAAFLKLQGLEGESTDSGHKNWIRIESVDSPIHRVLPEGAVDQARTKGQTRVGDVTILRKTDKTSPKLAENCANGTFFKEAEIHLCTTVKNKEEPFMKIKLQDVIVSSYTFRGNSSGQPEPSENVTLAYTEIEWTYVVVDPKDGSTKGNAVGKYNPSSGQS